MSKLRFFPFTISSTARKLAKANPLGGIVKGEPVVAHHFLKETRLSSTPDPIEKTRARGNVRKLFYRIGGRQSHKIIK